MTLTPDLNTLVEQSPMHYTFKNRSMPTAGIPSNRLLRTLLAACSKRLRGEAREKIDERRRTYPRTLERDD